jgi:hypothetical protein
VTVNCGGLLLFSRLLNRCAVPAVISLPRMTHPKLLAGLETHACTSVTNPLPLHV